MTEWVRNICSRFWRGKGWPEDFKEGVIVPIVKKGKGDVTREYRGVSLMISLYRIYGAVLAERLREEVEGDGIMPENQAGFRKERGVMDNIFLINSLANRQISKKRGKMVALFVDLRAA